MNVEREIERLRNDLNALTQAARGQPGGLQLLQPVSRVMGGVEYAGGIPIYLGRDASHPVLTSTDWNGDARSTAAKTLIDLSVVFGAPAGISAVYAMVSLRDSGSSGADCFLILGPNNTALEGIVWRCSGLANDAYHSAAMWVPCDANGDVYFQTAASDASTLDVYLSIYGWLL